ncbi:hypothetical protein ACFULT_25520 [Rhodococcus sp. NPDC057297]|uniref:hypothetical protein n=1 Tax=Rhodococcus sp. NPDC057297 TaxID=3346090 RepID=UPI00362E6E17
MKEPDISGSRSSDVESDGRASSTKPQETLPTNPPEKQRVSALISWAHRNPGWSDEQADEWRDTVLSFTATLRNPGGIDADIDLYHSDELVIDWTRFGPKQIDQCDFTLVVISKAWGERWAGTNDPTVGAGAAGEADALKGMFQDDQDELQRRVKFIILPGGKTADIPRDLRRLNYYPIDPDDFDSYIPLIRTLTKQPSFIRPEISDTPLLPPSIALKTGTSSNQTPRKSTDSVQNLKTELRVLRRRRDQLTRAEHNGTRVDDLQKIADDIAVLESLADSIYKSEGD